MDENSKRLGTEKVSSLLLKFSIPAITGMLVMALYNVVDRIFVGQAVHQDALAALLIAGALMTIIMGISMLFGIGTATIISIRLGQKRKDEATEAITHCFVILVAAGIIITIVGLIFLEPLLSLFGAKDASVLDYAVRYTRIILYGTIFQMIGFGLNHCTRAQGFPVITMLSMLIGALLNTILDPIFIFIFKMGVEGAALATIMSQAVSMIWMIKFNFGKKPIVRISLKGFKFKKEVALNIVAFGSAPFALQIATSLVMLLSNNALYKYGGSLAQSGVGIVNSYSMLLLMPIFGMNQGAQPILGYNYGARNFYRVKKCYLYSICACTAYVLLGFIITMTIPDKIVRLFTSSNSKDLIALTIKAMRIINLWLPFLGFQIFSTQFFQATGRPKIAMFLSLLRQLIVLAPLLLILPKFFGLYGVLFATPISDGVALLLSSILIIREFKKSQYKAALF